MVISSITTQVLSSNQITIIYDSFGNKDEFTQDWGFAALIEFNDQHIIFDTGNDSRIFAANVKLANIDLTKVDLTIISHRHSDHYNGLSHLVSVLPDVPIYIPNETFNLFEHEHDYENIHIDPNKLNINKVTNTIELSENVFIISTVRKHPNLSKLQELSLALKTSQGLILIVGCSHPGIIHIVAAAREIDERIVNVYGGFHMLRTPLPRIKSIVATLKDEYNVQNISPGHCTGERAQKEFASVFKSNYQHAELGSHFDLPE